MAVVLRKGLISAALLLIALGASAQRRASADVEVKTLADGKVTTVTKRVFCQGNGRLVTVFSSPSSYTTVTNLKGEFKLYVPSSNEVFSRVDKSFGSENELLYLFLSGRQDNLGLLGMGYTLQSSSYEEGYLKRTYTTKKKDTAPTVELVLKDYLPVYVAYLDNSGNVLSKMYLSHYTKGSRLVFPTRLTEITYNREKQDSTVVRTIYSSVSTDGSDPGFDFQVPAGAKPAGNPLDALKKK
ncbi:MAG: hypothetical protein J6W94_06570 [Bacteroidales bacterium]|nr:hypothetical protein [Bacteroidales bacterium]